MINSRYSCCTTSTPPPSSSGSGHHDITNHVDTTGNYRNDTNDSEATFIANHQQPSSSTSSLSLISLLLSSASHQYAHPVLPMASAPATVPYHDHYVSQPPDDVVNEAMNESFVSAFCYCEKMEEKRMLLISLLDEALSIIDNSISMQY
jgi:hypothetical protein